MSYVRGRRRKAKVWWPGCPRCHLKRGLGVSAIAAAHARDPAEFSVPRVSLLFFFFYRILIREPAKALKKRKQTNKINEQRQGRKKTFSGQSPWQG